MNIYFTALHVAVAKKENDIVMELLEADASLVPHTKESGNTALHLFCQAKFANTTKKKMMECAAKEGVINNCNNKGLTALHIATLREDTQNIHYLLEQGASVKIPNHKTGSTALHMACQKIRDRDTLQKIIEQAQRDQAIDYVNAEGWNALSAACLAGNSIAIKLLLEKNASIDVGRTNRGSTTLHLACEVVRDKEILQLIINKAKEHRSLNLVNREGLTPLERACMKKNMDAIELLLDADAKIIVDGSEGALHIACRQLFGRDAATIFKKMAEKAQADHVIDTERKELVAISIAYSERNTVALKALVAAGANLRFYTEGKRRTTLLHCMALEKGTAYDADLMQLTVSKAKMWHILDNKNEKGYTALGNACYYGNNEMVCLLLKEGASMKVSGPEVTLVNQLLHTRNYNIDRRSFRQLIDVAKRNGMIDTPNERNEFPLELAIGSGSTNHVEDLLHSGASLLVTKTHSKLLLHHIFQLSMPDEMRECIIRAAKAQNALDVPDFQGFTLMHMACQDSQEARVRMLLKAGASLCPVTYADKKTALHLALKSKLSDDLIIRIIQESKKQDMRILTHKDAKGRTPLDVASSYKKSRDILSLLKV